MKLLLFASFVCSAIPFGNASGLSLNNCTTLCSYCRRGQQDWIQTSSPWQLAVTTGDSVAVVANFVSPAAAYIAQDFVRTQMLLNSYWYTVEYAGIPVGISTSDVINSSAAILDGQYVQADLGHNVTAAGLLLQGGYCLDIDDNLIDPLVSWVTSLAVSFSLDGVHFSWITDFSGNIQVYRGNTDGNSEAVVSFPQAITASHWRIHPLAASNDFGATSQALLRFSIVQCPTTAAANQECAQPVEQCVMADWSTWSECTCFWDGCRTTRTRHVIVYPSCGGLQCDSLVDVTSCMTSSQAAAQWTGVGVACVVTVTIGCWLAYWQYRQQKNRRTRVEDAQHLETKKTDNKGSGDNKVDTLNEKQTRKRQLQELKKQKEEKKKQAREQKEEEKKQAKEQKKEAQRLRKKQQDEERRKAKEQQKQQQSNKNNKKQANNAESSLPSAEKDVKKNASSSCPAAAAAAAAAVSAEDTAAAGTGDTIVMVEGSTGAKAVIPVTGITVAVASASSADGGIAASDAAAAAPPLPPAAALEDGSQASSTEAGISASASVAGVGGYASYRRPSKLPPLPPLGTLKAAAPEDEEEEEDEEDMEPWPAGSGVHDGEDRWRKAQQLGSWRVGGGTKKTRGKKSRDAAQITSSLPTANRRASLLPKLSSFQS